MLRRESSSLSPRTFLDYKTGLCGNSSVVERHLAKVDVAGPTPVFRLNLTIETQQLVSLFFYYFGRLPGGLSGVSFNET